MRMGARRGGRWGISSLLAARRPVGTPGARSSRASQQRGRGACAVERIICEDGAAVWNLDSDRTHGTLVFLALAQMLLAALYVLRALLRGRSFQAANPHSHPCRCPRSCAPGAALALILLFSVLPVVRWLPIGASSSVLPFVRSRAPPLLLHSLPPFHPSSPSSQHHGYRSSGSHPVAAQTAWGVRVRDQGGFLAFWIFFQSVPLAVSFGFIMALIREVAEERWSCQLGAGSGSCCRCCGKFFCERLGGETSGKAHETWRCCGGAL
ncbi:hypothetical protein C8R45DRAFT_307395 [Mycena sanguinolenta]|nr:hypothetical protein C8R45DRAFT_307395 [Mycena sanguinolenta]